MIIGVTVQLSDFLPIPQTEDFVFILFCESRDGRQYNIEEFGSKASICKKYNIGQCDFFEWDTNHFKGRKCEIALRLFRRPKFQKFINDPFSSNKRQSAAA